MISALALKGTQPAGTPKYPTERCFGKSLLPSRRTTPLNTCNFESNTCNFDGQQIDSLVREEAERISRRKSLEDWRLGRCRSSEGDPHRIAFGNAQDRI